MYLLCKGRALYAVESLVITSRSQQSILNLEASSLFSNNLTFFRSNTPRLVILKNNKIVLP